MKQHKLATANQAEKDTVVTIRETAKKEALRYIVIFPLVMLASYILLMLYFKSKGGYKPVVLEEEEEPEATPY